MSLSNVNDDAVSAMQADDPVAPVWILNLLRYRALAQSGFGVDGLTGKEAYKVYGRKFAQLHPRFGGQPVWMGAADRSLIGGEQWDVVLLVHYPTRRQFLQMLADPDYLAIAPIREAALADNRLIETRQLLPKL